VKNYFQHTIILYFLAVACWNSNWAQVKKAKEILWTTDWSPNGKYIAIGGNTDSLRIYNGARLKSYKSIPFNGTITRLQWHPSKNTIAVATQLSADKPCLIDLDTNKKIELNGISADGARGLDWNATGTLLAVADNDGQILIYDTQGTLVKTIKNENGLSITAIDWHPDGKRLVVVSDKIRLFDTSGNLLKSIRHRPESVLLLSVAWHPSGAFFVTGDYGDSENKSLLQYWSQDGKLLQSVAVGQAEFRNLSWNPKGSRLATASDALRIWDLKGNLISYGKSPDYLWGVAWNKNGTRIVTSSLEQRIALWNAKAEELLVLE